MLENIPAFLDALSLSLYRHFVKGPNDDDMSLARSTQKKTTIRNEHGSHEKKGSQAPCHLHNTTLKINFKCVSSLHLSVCVIAATWQSLSMDRGRLDFSSSSLLVKQKKKIHTLLEMKRLTDYFEFCICTKINQRSECPK